MEKIKSTDGDSESSLETKQTLRKVSRVQNYVWNSLPNVTPKVIEGKNPKAINDFMEKYRYIDYKLNSENYLLFPKTLE